MYCGLTTEGYASREHIIPKAIGGTLRLNGICDKRVCENCNGGVLSQIDEELCCRSYLSIVASQEIAAATWQAWDIDHTSRELLIEARPDWQTDYTLNGLIVYPQIVFEKNGPEYRGDAEEALKFGHENLEPVLIRAARNAFQRWVHTNKGITFVKVKSDVVTDSRFRYPPRLYARRTLREIAEQIGSTNFTLRYKSDEEKRFSLRWLSKLGENRSKRQAFHMGSSRPTIATLFDVADTVRGLLKIGLNLIAAVCHNTTVSPQSFPFTIGQILRDVYLDEMFLRRNGFIRPQPLQAIAVPDAHSFRLLYTGKFWRIYSSFFGGRIGSCVDIPGPNLERHNMYSVIAPVKSDKWTIRPERILQLLSCQVEWHDSTRIVPSLLNHANISEIHRVMEKAQQKKPRKLKESK